MRQRKLGFTSILALAALVFATPAGAQLKLDVFVDPHPIVSGGSIGFAFLGNKFVGSVDHDGTAALYQTDLKGGNVSLFAPTVSIKGGSIDNEHILASSLGLGGFPNRDLYVAEGTSILHITNDGTHSGVFASNFTSPVRAMIFDGIGTFNYNLLVITLGGDVYRLNHAGVARFLASLGEDVEGMDIAPLHAGFSDFDGYLITIGAYSGLLRAVNLWGSVKILNQANPIPSPEGVHFVPLNLGATINPLEGFYFANWRANVLKVEPDQFMDFRGDAIVTTEMADHRISRVHWNGTNFEITVIGNVPNQPEDGFFIGPDTLNPIGVCPTPAENPDDGGHAVWCWPRCKKIVPHFHRRTDDTI